MSQKPHRKGKALPANFGKGRSFKSIGFYKPTLRERAAIAAGGNLLIMVNCITAHNPGKCAIGIFPELTTCTDANDAQFKIEAARKLAEETTAMVPESVLTDKPKSA